MIKKNDRVEVLITSVTSEGSGVGRVDNFAVFIPKTAPGDLVLAHIIKVNKTYAIGKMLQIITPSDKRVENACPVFMKCGGCAYRHISYEQELALKKESVTQNFKKLGGIDFPCEKINSFKDERYRNKAQYPIGQNEDGTLFAGFYAPHSHRVIKCEDCLLQPKIFSDIINSSLVFLTEKKVRAFDIENYEENLKSKNGRLRHIFLRIGEKTGQIMLCLVVSDFKIDCLDEFSQYITQKYPEIKTIVLNKNCKNTNVILGKEEKCIYGNGIVEDTLCDLKFKISPLSFYQVNRIAAENLYLKAKEFASLKKDDVLLDIYCGAGTIGLSMAKDCKEVIGCEIIQAAVDNAKENARANNIINSEFYCMDACDFAKEVIENKKIKADVVVVDPPRKGCERPVLEAISKISPQKIVMISCNSATAARDCSVLIGLGYKIERMEAFDLFPRTSHEEMAVLMSRVR